MDGAWGNLYMMYWYNGVFVLDGRIDMFQTPMTPMQEENNSNNEVITRVCQNAARKPNQGKAAAKIIIVNTTANINNRQQAFDLALL